MDIKKEIEEIMKIIESLDMIDVTKRRQNQSKINRAYKMLEELKNKFK